MNLPKGSSTNSQHTPDLDTSTETAKQGRFNPLESQLAQLQPLTDRIVRKHRGKAEREQLPFWIGILTLALLGIAGMALRDYYMLATAIALIMIVGVFVVVIFPLKSLQGRFGRRWSEISADGEMFRFLRNAGVVLGHPVEMGNPDERIVTHLAIPFPEAVRAVESYIKNYTLPESIQSDSTGNLFMPAGALERPSGSPKHRVYEVEYRGTVIRPLSIRVDAGESGSEVTIGFMLRPSNAETRERLVNSIVGRLQDRMIAAKILSDIREAAGMEPISIPVTEPQAPVNGAEPSRAI